MPDALRTQIVAAVTSRAIPAPTSAAGHAGERGQRRARRRRRTRRQIDAAKRDRVYLAVFLSMASPDYLIQK